MNIEESYPVDLFAQTWPNGATHKMNTTTISPSGPSKTKTNLEIVNAFVSSA